MTDFYQLMIEQQQWGGLGVVEEQLAQLSEEAQLSEKEKPFFVASFGRIPFDYNFKTLTGIKHQKLFGTRFIEDPSYSQELEAKAYIPSTIEAHMSQLALKATQDYLRQIEGHLSLSTLKKLSLMDIGCGTGHQFYSLVKAIQEKYPKLELSCVLLDNSAAMLESARKTFQDTEYPVTFLHQAIEDPVKGNQVDVVLSHTMLHHLEKPFEACEKMKLYGNKLVLIRDLSRPPLAFFDEVFQEQGKHYEGGMKQLFKNSLFSALSYPEFCALAKQLKAKAEVIAPMYQVLIISL